MKLPCYIMLNNRPFTYGWVIGVVDSKVEYGEINEGSRTAIYGDKYTTKALVVLASFDKGRVVEMRWDKIKVTDSIQEAEDACKVH